MPGGFSALALMAGACIETGLVSVDGPPLPPPVAAPAPREPVDPWVEYTGATGLLDDLPPESGLPATFLFAPDTLHRFDLELSDDALDALRDDARTDVPATLRYADQSWEVGLHLKGSRSLRGLSEKAGFKIDVGEFVEDQTFYGLRRLTLNNMVQDRSMIREHTVYRAYADIGVPAPRHGYAEVWVNDEPYGLYGVLDTMDGPFARWAIPEDGEGWLYEGGDGADVLAGREDRFKVQASGAGEPYADLAALVTELDAAADVMDVLEARFDPSVFRMWATDIAAGHRDGYVRRRNNYLLYHGPLTDRWWMIPWGNDQAFREASDPYTGFFGRLLTDCERSERCRDRLEQALEEVVDAWEAQDLAGYADATGAFIAEACERDPRREALCGHDNIVEFIEARPGQIRGGIE